MKSQVYSWRISEEDKAELEHAARIEGVTVAQLLDRVIHAWLAKRQEEAEGDAAEQARLRGRVMRAIGTLRGGRPDRAERARETLRERLRERGR